MHYVRRSPEPASLPDIRKRYTPGWIRHKNSGGDLPNDHRWTDYRSDLEYLFGSICAYCEELSKGEIDHFRPKSLFPELVYIWSNWLLSCRSCNHSKLNNWPEIGYVDPCARLRRERPEAYFCFNTSTGFMLPLPNLDDIRHQRAVTMIRDLKMNAFHHVQKRKQFAFFLQLAIDKSPNPSMVAEDLRNSLGSEIVEVVSFIRAWLVDKGYK